MPASTHSAICLANSDGTAKEYANTNGGAGGDNSIVAFDEVSPALAAHTVGSYIRYNETTYLVKTDISIGDSLVVDANIEVPTLPEGTVIYTPGGEGGAGSDQGAIEALVNVYGSKNLNSYPYNETSKDASGLTWTDNGDGSITVKGSTSASNPTFEMHSFHSSGTYPLILKNGSYKISGCPQDGSDTTYYFRVFTVQTGPVVDAEAKDYGNGATLTINGSADSPDWARVNVAIYVKSGANLPTEGITFYPMIRDARIQDDTYVPYAMTNRELTEKIVNWDTHYPITATNFDLYGQELFLLLPIGISAGTVVGNTIAIFYGYKVNSDNGAILYFRFNGDARLYSITGGSETTRNI